MALSLYFPPPAVLIMIDAFASLYAAAVKAAAAVSRPASTSPSMTVMTIGSSRLRVISIWRLGRMTAFFTRRVTPSASSFVSRRMFIIDLMACRRFIMA